MARLISGFTAPPPKTTAINKLASCLTALGMNIEYGQLGGGQFAILGSRADLRLAIEVRYDTGETPTGKPSSKFAWARVRDPIGIVSNLEFDYSIGPKRQKELGMTADIAERRGAELNARYNDGAQATSHTAHFSTAGEMNEWLDEWLDTLKIEHKRQSPKKKAKPTDLDLMLGASWQG